MKVSVAMATYNGSRHLREQLESIRRQTLLPNELVVSDDGSTDDTVAIVRDFAADAPFAVVVDDSGQHLGFTQNFVRAIRRCSGDIVALCDQDDVWDEGKLAAAVREFDDPKVTTVTHRVRVVDENLNPTALIEPAVPYQGDYTVFTIDPWFSPNGMQMLFRRAAISPWLDRTPPLSAYGSGTAPFDEWIFYLGTLTGTAVLTPDILGVWRRHGSAMTRDLQGIEAEKSLGHGLHLAMNSGGEIYTFKAEVTASRAEFVAGRSVSDTVVPGAEDFYRRMSATFRRRARLHGGQSTFGQRLRSFVGMLTRWDHRSRDRGGLGGKAILKDAFTVVFGPRKDL